MADPELARRRLQSDVEREQAETSLGLAQDVNPDENAREREALQNRPSERLMRDRAVMARSPILQHYLSDPGAAIVAQDSVPQLAVFEQLNTAFARGFPVEAPTGSRVFGPGSDVFSAMVAAEAGAEIVADAPSGFRRTREAFHQGRLDEEYSMLAYRSAMAVRHGQEGLSAEEQARLDYLASRPGGDDWGPLVLGPLSRLTPQMIGGYARGWRAASAGFTDVQSRIYNTDQARSEQQQRLLSGNPFIQAVDAPATALSLLVAAGHGLGGYLSYGYEMEAGTFYDTAVRQGVAPEIAARDAELYGGVATALELGLTSLGIKYSGLPGIARSLSSRITGSRILTPLTARAVFRGAAAELLKGGGTEGLEEGSQSVAQSVITEMAQREQRGQSADPFSAAFGIVTDPQLRAAALGDAMASFWIGFQGGVGMGVVPTALHTQLGLGDVRRARYQMEIFDAMNAGSAAPLRDRVPAEFGRAVEILTNKGAQKEFHVGAEAFVGFFQDQNVDPKVVADELGVGRAALEEALDSGGDIVIPMKTWAAKVANSKYDALGQHARFGPDSMTPHEVQARQTLKIDLERAASEAKRINVLLDKRQQLIERFAAKMRESKAFGVDDFNTAVATAWADLTANMAREAGVAPEDLPSTHTVVVGPFGHSAEAEQLVAAELERRGLDPTIATAGAAAQRTARIAELEAQGIDAGMSEEDAQKQGVLNELHELQELQLQNATIATAQKQVAGGAAAAALDQAFPTLPRLTDLDAKKITLKMAAQAFHDEHMKTYGRRLAPETNEGDYQLVLEMAASEVEQQLKEASSGVGWYGQDVLTALQLTAQVFPTLLTKSSHRDLFLAFAGIFSSGNTPEAAWVKSAEAFDYFLATGRIPVKRLKADGTPVALSTFKDNKTGEQVTKPVGWSQRSQHNEQLLAFLGWLVDDLGSLEEAIKWLITRHERTAINEAMTRSGLYKELRYKTKAERAGAPEYGALAFGEKLGRYSLGLFGLAEAERDTTVDLWYIRSFRRWVGGLFETPVEPITGVVGGPTPTDREVIFRITGDLAKRFGIGIGDVQAVLWFWEKRLYREQGVRTEEGTSSSGARLLLDKRGLGDDRARGAGAGGEGVADDAGAAGPGARGEGFGQPGKGGRGFVEFERDADGLITRAVAYLREGSDASTPVHEIFGHIYLETLRWVAAQPGASEQVKADWQATLDWFSEGHTEQITNEMWAEWSSLPPAQAVAKLRPFHEKFALGMEQYFLEGRAPSERLARVFRKFGVWFGRIYQSFGGKVPGAELNDKMRDVFARMFAASEEIEEARRASGADLTLTREQWGPLNNAYADESYERYKTHIEREREAVERDVQRAAIAAIVEGNTRERRRAARRARATVEAEMKEDPAWVALDTLLGALPIDDGQSVRLNPALTLMEYGEELVKRLPVGVVGADAEALVQLALTAKKARRPVRMFERVQQLKVADPTGVLAAILGSRKGLPADGRTVESAIEQLWEEGYFGPVRHGYEQLGGVGAATAPLAKLMRAAEMAGDGRSEEDIWQETGWAFGDDGLPRFEIDTSEARLIVKLNVVGPTAIRRLEDVLHFPALYEAYPQLKDVPVDLARGRAGGYWQRRDEVLTVTSAGAADWVPLITVRAPGASDALSILLHEVQHAIQDIEGFATGGDPDFAASEFPQEAQRLVDEKAAERFEALKDSYWKQVIFGTNDDLFMEHCRKQARSVVGWEIYRRLAGEVEARNVQYRAGMTPEDRLRLPPGTTANLDVDAPLRIVSMAKPEDAFSREQGKVGFDQPMSLEEFLQRLDEDVKDIAPVYRAADEDAAFDWAESERIRNWFASRGVDIDQKADLVRAAIEAAAVELDDRGTDADRVAELVNDHLGSEVFKNGHEMLEAVAALPPRQQWLKEKTEDRVLAELGDPLELGMMADEANRGMHTPNAEQRLQMEFDAIARAAGGAGVSRPINRLARDYAERMIDGASVKQVEHFEWYLAHERRWAKRAMEALARGDAAAAQDAKYKQLLNFHLYKQARKAAAEMARALNYFKGLQRATIRDKIDNDYLDRIDALLADYELRKLSQVQIERNISLTQWAAQMEADGRGHMVNVDPRLLDAANRKPFVQMTVEDARSLRDAVQNLDHLGRLKDRLLTAQDRRTFTETMDELVARIAATGPLSQKMSDRYSPGFWGKRTRQLRKLHAEWTRMEFLFRYLDGGFNGPLWRALWMPLAQAADKEAEMAYGIAQEFDIIWERYGSDRAALYKTTYTMPTLAITSDLGTHRTFTRAELIAIALNLGNDGNVAATVDGFKWFTQEGKETDYTLARDKIIAELETVLTARDWETVQMIWDLVGRHRDEAFQLQEDLTGVRPEAVEAVPLTTSHGVLEGGYYPIKFDPSRHAKVEKDDLRQQALDQWGGNFTRPMTKQGHLIERTSSGGKPVWLSLEVASTHMMNMAHDIAYRRAVIDVNRIINDARFRTAFIGVAGKEMYDQLKPWLQGIAVDRKDPSSEIAKFLMHARAHVQIASMGIKIATATQQIAGVLQAVPMLGGPEMTISLGKIMAQPLRWIEFAKFILTKSAFMRQRVRTFNRDVREVLQRIENDSVKHKLQRNAFILVGGMDWVVSSVVWMTAYDKANAGNVPGIEGGDEANAILFADSIVRQTQSAGLKQDLPALMRTDEMGKLVTSFYSYFSVLYNWTAYDQIMGVRKGRVSPLIVLSNLFLIYVFSPLLTEWLAGRWDKDDEDDEDKWKRLWGVVARALFSPIPGLRDLANAYGEVREYKISPAESGIQSIIDSGEDIFDLAGKTVEGRPEDSSFFSSERAGKRLSYSAGYLFGLPTPQLWITGDYIADKIEGEEEEGFDPVEAFLRDTR